jgi:hypothetical protein
MSTAAEDPHAEGTGGEVIPPPAAGSAIQLGAAAQLQGPARARFEQSIQRFAEDLWKEVDRLEAAQRATSGEREVTSTMVHVAETFLRQGYGRGRRSTRLLVINLGAYAATLACGVTINFLKSGWGIAGFVITFSLALILASVVYLKEG